METDTSDISGVAVIPCTRTAKITKSLKRAIAFSAGVMVTVWMGPCNIHCSIWTRCIGHCRTLKARRNYNCYFLSRACAIYLLRRATCNKRLMQTITFAFLIWFCVDRTVQNLNLLPSSMGIFVPLFKVTLLKINVSLDTLPCQSYT